MMVSEKYDISHNMPLKCRMPAKMTLLVIAIKKKEFIYRPARSTITSATCFALVKGKSVAFKSVPASPAVIFTS